MTASIFEKTQLALRAAVAASLSLLVADLVHLRQPIYALLAAIIVTDTSAARTRRLGASRLVSTAIGALCGGLMSAFLPQNPWMVGAGTLFAMLACIAINMAAVARVAGYVCGIILIGHAANPWTYSLNRFTETAVGVAVAWGVSLAPRLIRPRAAAAARQASQPNPEN